MKKKKKATMKSAAAAPATTHRLPTEHRLDDPNQIRLIASKRAQRAQRKETGEPKLPKSFRGQPNETF